MTLNDIIQESHKTAVDKGWWETKDRNLGELLMLMVTELAEAMEETRKTGLNDPIRFENGKPEGLAIELADLIIRLGDMCGRYNIPLQKAVEIKLEYNKTRSYRHGGKLA